MKHHISSSTTTDDDQDQPQNAPPPPSHWWRTADEFANEDGFFRFDAKIPLQLSNLTPRLKLLREMERLGLIAEEGLDDLRHKLITYRSGDFWLPIGGIKKEDMEIPQAITVLLVGLSGSGKSSLVNLMYSVLGRSGLIPFSQTSNGCSNYTTMFMEEHNVLRSMRSGFCVYDTRGLDVNQLGEGLEDVSDWMTDGVRHNQACFRPGDGRKNIGVFAFPFSSQKFAKRRVNCVMVVANLAEAYNAFKSADFKHLEAIKSLFHLPSIRKSNENPILILTHGDTLTTEERIDGRLTICEYLGIPETTGAYDIACLTEQGILPEESDPVTSFALTEAIYRALMQSDRTHLPKRKWKDWVVFILSKIMCWIAAFFAFLAHFFSQFGHQHKLKNL